MNEHIIFDAIGALPDRFIQEAAPRARQYRLRWAMIAACLALVIGLGIGGVHLYRTPVSYVSIDINPSLELSLNRWDRVVEVTAYNADAKAVCDTVDLLHLPYNDALCQLLTAPALQSYLVDDADLTITVVAHHPEKLCQATESCEPYQENGGQVHHSDYETLTEAHENDCSVGKYAAYQELASCDSSVTLDDCRGMTMHEIHSEIESHHGSNHAEEHHESARTEESHCDFSAVIEPDETSSPTSSPKSGHHGSNHH